MDPVDIYLTDCRIRDLGSKTIDLYRQRLTRFVEVAGFPGSKPLLIEFLGAIPNPRTRHGYWRAVRAFVRWAAVSGLCEDWTAGVRVACPDAPREVPLDLAEFERLLAAIPALTDRGRRDRALYACLFYTGARRDAVRLLRRADVNLDGRWIRTVSKGRKEALVSLPRRAAALLNLWLARCPSEAWVFPSLNRPDRPIDPNHVGRQIHAYAAAAGIDRRVHVHLLRHSFATHLLDRGVGLEVIQAALGHSSIQTTQIYARVSAGQIRSALDRVFS